MPEALVRALHADCHRMTLYRGKGDAHYAAFNQAADELMQACAHDDLARARRAVRELAVLRDSCHARYK